MKSMQIVLTLCLSITHIINSGEEVHFDPEHTEQVNHKQEEEQQKEEALKHEEAHEHRPSSPTSDQGISSGETSRSVSPNQSFAPSQGEHIAPVQQDTEEKTKSDKTDTTKQDYNLNNALKDALDPMQKASEKSLLRKIFNALLDAFGIKSPVEEAKDIAKNLVSLEKALQNIKPSQPGQRAEYLKMYKEEAPKFKEALSKLSAEEKQEVFTDWNEEIIEANKVPNSIDHQKVVSDMCKTMNLILPEDEKLVFKVTTITEKETLPNGKVLPEGGKIIKPEIITQAEYDQEQTTPSLTEDGKNLTQTFTENTVDQIFKEPLKQPSILKAIKELPVDASVEDLHTFLKDITFSDFSLTDQARIYQKIMEVQKDIYEQDAKKIQNDNSMTYMQKYTAQDHIFNQVHNFNASLLEAMQNFESINIVTILEKTHIDITRPQKPQESSLPATLTKDPNNLDALNNLIGSKSLNMIKTSQDSQKIATHFESILSYIDFDSYSPTDQARIYRYLVDKTNDNTFNNYLLDAINKISPENSEQIIDSFYQSDFDTTKQPLSKKDVQDLKKQISQTTKESSQLSAINNLFSKLTPKEKVQFIKQVNSANILPKTSGGGGDPLSKLLNKATAQRQYIIPQDSNSVKFVTEYGYKKFIGK